MIIYKKQFVGMIASVVALITPMCTYCLLPLVGISVGSEIYDFIKNHKAPIRIAGIKGAMPNEYAIIETIIKFNPKDKSAPMGSLGSSPIIIRTKQGTISPTKTAQTLDIKLEVPSQPLDLSSAMYNMPEIVSKAAGAVDPKAGAVAGLVSALVEMSAQVGTEQINKIFGTDETTLSVLDIFPTKYYNFNVSTNQFELKPQFKTDLQTYVNLMESVKPKVAAFNNANKEYIQARAKYLNKYHTVALPEDATSQQEADYDAVVNLNDTKLMPAFKEMAKDYLRIDQYGMHRVSIMAANLKPGDLCSRIGDGWNGPFRLWVYYYLGAKLTNVFTLDYCVNTKTSVQDVLVQISPNIIDNYGNIVRGGVQFIAVKKNDPTLTKCTGSDCVIGFPKFEGGKAVASPISDTLCWWDSAITSADEGIGLAQYLLPCDLTKLKQAYTDIKDEKRKAIAADALKAIDALQKAFSDKGTQQQLLDPTSNNESTAIPSGSSMSSILGMINSILGGKPSTITPTTPPTTPPTKPVDLEI